MKLLLLFSNSAVGKMTVTINGGAAFGSAQLPVAELKFNTASTDFVVPYNFDFILENGTYNVENHLALLPGAGMYVAENANLVVAENVRFTVFDGLRDYSHYNYKHVLKSEKKLHEMYQMSPEIG
jgi:hypothetical protein